MKTRGWGWIVLAAAVSGVLPSGTFAQRLNVEAESYASSHDVGGTPIRPWPYTDCSSGYVLAGLDTPGEWAQYDVAFPSAASYSLVIKCQGHQGREYALRLVLVPADGGSSQVTEFSFTGLGYG